MTPAFALAATLAVWEGCLHTVLDELDRVPDALAAYTVAEARCQDLEPADVSEFDRAQVREGLWTRAVLERGGRP